MTCKTCHNSVLKNKNQKQFQPQDLESIFDSKRMLSTVQTLFGYDFLLFDLLLKEMRLFTNLCLPKTVFYHLTLRATVTFKLHRKIAHL